MRAGFLWQTALLSLCFAAVGCRLPGKPGPEHVPTRPDQITDFEVLYRGNCQACHGAQGQDGMAVSLASPAYIAYAGREHIAQITANGIVGSLMPAFASNAGGMLTDQQVQILADGIVSRWGNAAALHSRTPPPYESQATGNVPAGETLYRADCLRCHAPGGSSILDPTYLALVSNGGLRTLLVAGKPHEGMPDWTGYPGGPLGDQKLADLVKFMVSHRNPAPGQAFPNEQGAAHPAGISAEDSAARAQQKLSTQAGPATGGPKFSNQPVPVATPKHTTSPKP